VTFLERMADASRERVRRARAAESESKLARRAERTARPPPLTLDRFDVIAELKLRSPAAGGLADWLQKPKSCLALVIVLDQFPRNMFRGTARAFAADAAALEAARTIVDRGWDQAFSPDESTFAYLPFEHSESLQDQERSLRLFEGNENYEWARKHYEVVRRFGRFPHRNAALGRASTPEEVEFLAQPGSSF